MQLLVPKRRTARGRGTHAQIPTVTVAAEIEGETATYDDSSTAALVMRVWTLFLLLPAVAQSQPDFPHVSFMGNTLPNHAFVDLDLVGDLDNDSVICHTDLPTCCSSTQGPDSGGWHFPGGARLPFSNSSGSVYELRSTQQVRLSRREGNVTSGIYRCDVPTNASSVETTYVGLYSSGGDITIIDDVMLTVNSDLNGPSPQFTLACISTGGPATTVTWTRDSTTVTQGTQTVLNDTVTARYTHTLTVTGILGGLYTCTVANDKPSSVSSSFYVEVASAPTNLTAVQEGPTSIAVSWSPPTPLGDTTEYRILYTGANSSSGSVTVSATDSSFFSDASGSGDVMDSDLTHNYTLAGLHNGDTYSISVVALSQYLPSDTVMLDRNVPLFPTQPTIGLTTPTETSVSITWTVDAGSVVESYRVLWQRDTSVGCPGEDEGNETLTGDPTSHNVTGLEEDSSYIITLWASNAAGSVDVGVAVMTLEAAPSGSPGPVNVSGATSSSITVQWEMVDCIESNGNVTGYSVRVEAVGRGYRDTVNVSGSNTTSVRLTGLSPSTAYTIEVAAVNGAGVGVYSNPTNQSTFVETPTVTVLQSSVSSTTLPVKWTGGGSVVDGYVVQWTYDGDCTGVSGGSVSVGGDVTNFTIEGLEEFSPYSVSVNAANSISSAVSNETSGMTNEAVPSAPPRDVNASLSGFNITVQWERVECIHRNGYITGYIVRYREADTQTAESLNVSLNSTGRREETLSGLSAATVYAIQVAAVNTAGVGTYSDTVKLLIPARAPVLVLQSQPDAFTASLSWTTAGPEVDKYILAWQRDTSVGCAAEDEGSATVADGSTSYTVTGLSGGSSYSVTVTASTAVNVAVSEELVIQTAEAAPTAPVAFVSVSDVTPTSATLQWGPVPCIHRNGNIRGYMVAWTSSDDTSLTSDMIPAPNTTYTITGLMSGSMYTIVVIAVNERGRSTSSPRSVSTNTESVPEPGSSVSGPLVGGVAGGGVLIIIFVLIVILVVYLVRRRGRNYIPELRSKLSTFRKGGDDLHMREFTMPGKYTQTTVVSNDYVNVGVSAEIDRNNESELLKKEVEDDRYVSVVEPASKEKETEGYVQMRPLAVPVRETLDKDADADGYVSARVIDGGSTPDKEEDGYISARALDGFVPSTPEKEIISTRPLDSFRTSTPGKEEAGDGYVDARILEGPQPRKQDKELGGVRKSLAMDNEYVTMRSQTTSQPGTKKIDSYKPARTATMPANRNSEADGYDTVRTFATLRPSSKPTPEERKKKKLEGSGPTEDGYEVSRPLATLPLPPPKLPPKGKVDDDDDMPEDGYENSRPLATTPPKLLPKGKVEDDEDLPEDGYENSRPLATSPSPELPTEDEEDGYENSRPLANSPPPKLPPKKDDDDLPEDDYENSRLLSTLPPPTPPDTEEPPYLKLR